MLNVGLSQLVTFCLSVCGNTNRLLKVHLQPINADSSMMLRLLENENSLYVIMYFEMKSQLATSPYFRGTCTSRVHILLAFQACSFLYFIFIIIFFIFRMNNQHSAV